MAWQNSVAACERHLGSDAELCMAREDWRSGFFQAPLHPSSAQLLCAIAWDPDAGIRIFKPLKLGFGGAGAPYQFCRASYSTLQIISEMFWVPAVPHMDDYVIMDTCECMPSARQSVVLTMNALGFHLAEDKAAPPRTDQDTNIGTGVKVGIALGVEWGWQTTPKERIAAEKVR